MTVSPTYSSVLTDIDVRKRAEAQPAGEKQLLEMIASGRSPPTEESVASLTIMDV